jgi:hypothetical protein
LWADLKLTFPDCRRSLSVDPQRWTSRWIVDVQHRHLLQVDEGVSDLNELSHPFLLGIGVRGDLAITSARLTEG